MFSTVVNTTASTATRRGSSVRLHIAVAASAKPKPVAPEMMPAISAPSVSDSVSIIAGGAGADPGAGSSSDSCT